jgi:replication initiation protein RepC
MELRISDAGKRRITPEIAAGRQVARAAAAHFVMPADRFDVLRDVAKARKELGLTPVALRVLEIFVGLLRPADISAGLEPIARPSNAFLEQKTGYSLSALKRGFRNLLAAGLVLEKRSANGKRFARKNVDGFITEAFGFDLSPLFGRAGELKLKAQRIEAEERALRDAREDFTRYRMAIEAELAACAGQRVSQEWQGFRDALGSISTSIDRFSGIYEIELACIELQTLLSSVEKLRESMVQTVKMDPNGVQNEPHIQSTNPDVFPSCRNRSSANAPQHRSKSAASGTKSLRKKAGDVSAEAQTGKPVLDPNIDLPLVFYACPSVERWAKGACRNWDSFITSARQVLFPALGIGQHAWDKAASVMSERGAAVATALVLERQSANQINTTAGAYFTAMIDRAREGELRLHASLMKLAKERNE